MKFFKPYCLVLFLVFSSPSYGGWVTGAGAKSCGYYLANFQNFTLRKAFVFWLQGYVTGVNIERSASKGQDFDTDAVEYELKNYCEKNPSADFYVAAQWIYSQKLK